MHAVQCSTGGPTSSVLQDKFQKDQGDEGKNQESGESSLFIINAQPMRGLDWLHQFWKYKIHPQSSFSFLTGILSFILATKYSIFTDIRPH